MSPIIVRAVTIMGGELWKLLNVIIQKKTVMKKA